MNASQSQPVTATADAATSGAEPSAAFTPGPWRLEQPETWPFDLMVLGPDGDEVISLRRWAHASGQKSVADCLRAAGFPHQERPRLIEALAQQVATMRLIAAAPDLLAACQAMVRMYDGETPPGDLTPITTARAAVANALGADPKAGA